MTDSVAEYRRRYGAFLTQIAAGLQVHIAALLADCENIDRIAARAKDPESFAGKANLEIKAGVLKYEKPLTEMQDLIGARVTVLYRDDVDRVATAIGRYFQAIEHQELVPESQWEFGYSVLHLILPLPRDVVPESVELSEVPTFFELQIKTLYEHAWSETSHDLAYKPPKPLTPDQERRMAFTAAQSWGADHIIQDLRDELYA